MSFTVTSKGKELFQKILLNTVKINDIIGNNIGEQDVTMWFTGTVLVGNKRQITDIMTSTADNLLMPTIGSKIKIGQTDEFVTVMGFTGTLAQENLVITVDRDLTPSVETEVPQVFTPDLFSLFKQNFSGVALGSSTNQSFTRLLANGEISSDIGDELRIINHLVEVREVIDGITSPDRIITLKINIDAEDTINYDYIHIFSNNEIVASAPFNLSIQTQGKLIDITLNGENGLYPLYTAILGILLANVGKLAYANKILLPFMSSIDGTTAIGNLLNINSFAIRPIMYNISDVATDQSRVNVFKEQDQKGKLDDTSPTAYSISATVLKNNTSTMQFSARMENETNNPLKVYGVYIYANVDIYYADRLVASYEPEVLLYASLFGTPMELGRYETLDLVTSIPIP